MTRLAGRGASLRPRLLTAIGCAASISIDIAGKHWNAHPERADLCDLQERRRRGYGLPGCGRNRLNEAIEWGRNRDLALRPDWPLTDRTESLARGIQRRLIDL